MKIKEPTATSEVLRVLRETDDFMDMPEVARLARKSMKNVGTALWWLRRIGAVDVVVNADGKGWWYARPSEEDQRSRHLDERTPESRPRAPKRKKGGS
jgi:hypothetical protein